MLLELKSEFAGSQDLTCHNTCHALQFVCDVLKRGLLYLLFLITCLSMPDLYRQAKHVLKDILNIGLTCFVIPAVCAAFEISVP